MRYLPFFLLVGLLWAGGQSLHTALTSRRPTVLSYEDYARTKPSATWIIITNCQLDLTRACYLSYVGDQNPYQYYIPVESRSFPTGKVCILLKTADPGLKATIAEIGTLKSDTAAKAWLLKNLGRVFPRQDVRGLLCYGIDLKSSEREKLASVEKNLTQDFIILDSDAQPSLAAGISYTTSGLAVLAGLILYSRQKSRSANCGTALCSS